MSAKYKVDDLHVVMTVAVNIPAYVCYRRFCRHTGNLFSYRISHVYLQ
jgi:hypothetical protein